MSKVWAVLAPVIIIVGLIAAVAGLLQWESRVLARDSLEHRTIIDCIYANGVPVRDETGRIACVKEFKP